MKASTTSHGDSAPHKHIEREQARSLLPGQRRHVPPPVGSDAAAFLAQLNEIYGGPGVEIDAEDEELPRDMRSHMRQVLDQDT